MNDQRSWKAIAPSVARREVSDLSQNEGTYIFTTYIHVHIFFFYWVYAIVGLAELCAKYAALVSDCMVVISSTRTEII